MKRRQLMQYLTAGTTVGLAGCTALGNVGGNATTLGVIEVINFSRVRNRIRLLVVRDQETVLDEQYVLGPFDAGLDASTEIIRPRWPKEAGRYTLKTHHVGADGDRETNSAEYTFTKEDYDTYYGGETPDPGCIGAVVKVGSDASEPNATIGISPTKVENPCGDGGDP